MLSLIHATSDTWAATAAHTLATQLSAALSARGQATLVVPGGRTAVQVLPFLAKQPLDWDHITVTLSDERWVPAHSADSNERLVRETLLDPTGAAFVGLKTAAASPAEAVSACTTRLASLSRPFDAVFLGMGDDGHTASLFPAQAIEAGDVQVAIRPDHPRLSMTPKCLLNSRHIVLPVCGDAKQEVFRKAQAPGPAETFPIRHILHQDLVPVSVVLG